MSRHRLATRSRWSLGSNARRALPLLALSSVAALVMLGMPAVSGATFTSTSTSRASVTAASDWTPPTVSVRNPGVSVRDTVTITADASDAQSGISSVTIQYLAPGASTWTKLCTVTTSPFGCSWNTKTVADGTNNLRAIAADNAGYSTTSESTSTTVANNLLVVLGDPGDVVRGTVPLTATLFNSGILPYIVSIQAAVSGTTSWKTICSTAIPAYTCNWNTTSGGYVQGETYDLRAVATVGISTTTSATIDDVLIDNVAPTVTMVDPGSPLRGTVTFTANATDADSGVSTVTLQHQRSGTGTWTTFCTVTTDPFSCRYATAQLTDGTYSFRAVAVDGANNSATSATVANRVVDNTVTSVSVEDPGAYLAGTVTLTAAGSSTAGIASIRIDRAPSGTSTWTTICTDTTAPYTCAFDTTKVTEGLYDFRAVLTDNLGRTTTSATSAGHRVDNSPLRGYDVQATNGGATVGKLGAGDVLTLTYTDEVSLTSITAGWDGSALGVTLRLRDGNLVGTGSKGDTIDVLRNGSAVNLGSVNLKGDYAKNNKTIQINATMVASSIAIGGQPATVVTITLGSTSSGSGLRTQSSSAAMVWTPSASAVDVLGRAASTSPVTELGTLDRDF